MFIETESSGRGAFTVRNEKLEKGKLTSENVKRKPFHICNKQKYVRVVIGKGFIKIPDDIEKFVVDCKFTF